MNRAVVFLVAALCLSASPTAAPYGSLTFSCGTAHGDYFLPAFRAIQSTKYTGLNRQDIESIVTACRNVLEHKDYLYDARCNAYPLFQSQLRDLIDAQCPFYIDTYGKDFPAKRDARVPADAPGSTLPKP